MILTVTINPAIDKIITADRLVFEDRAYILSNSETAGGRGINASRVLHSFGAATLAILPSGGSNGAVLEASLRNAGFPVEIVPVKRDIRTNLTITDKQGLTIKLNEAGPVLEKAELSALEAAVEKHLPEAQWLMLCGSLPPSAPNDYYCNLIEMARARNVRTLLDTDNEALVEGLEAKPTVVTPNQQEAERLLNRALITKTQFLEAVQRIQVMGAESVLLSLGSRGVLAAHNGQIHEVRPPRVDAVCPIGSGDAMGAAFVWAMSEGKDFLDAVRWGVAAGTGKAVLPGVCFATFDQVKAVYKEVDVRPAR